MHNIFSSFWDAVTGRYKVIMNTTYLMQVYAELKLKSDLILDKRVDAAIKHQHLDSIDALVDAAVEYIKNGAAVNHRIDIGYVDFRASKHPFMKSQDHKDAEELFFEKPEMPMYTYVPKILWLSLDRKIDSPEWDEISARYNSAMKKLFNAVLDYGKPNLKEQYKGMDIISKVVCNGDAEALQKILDNYAVGINNKSYGAVPLQYAFTSYINGVKGAKESVEILLKYGARTDAQWIGDKGGSSISDFIKANYSSIYNEFFKEEASVVELNNESQEVLVTELTKITAEADA